MGARDDVQAELDRLRDKLAAGGELTGDEEDFVLAYHPKYVEAHREAEAELAAGKTIPLEQLIAELTG